MLFEVRHDEKNSGTKVSSWYLPIENGITCVQIKHIHIKENVEMLNRIRRTILKCPISLSATCPEINAVPHATICDQNPNQPTVS